MIQNTTENCTTQVKQSTQYLTKNTWLHGWIIHTLPGKRCIPVDGRLMQVIKKFWILTQIGAIGDRSFLVSIVDVILIYLSSEFPFPLSSANWRMLKMKVLKTFLSVNSFKFLHNTYLNIHVTVIAMVHWGCTSETWGPRAPSCP